MKLHKYTLEQLKKSVESSNSIRGCLIKLGVKPYGGNYEVFRKAIKYFNIDTSHFTGQAHNKGNKLPEMEIPIEEYLSNKRQILTVKLKKKLYKNGLKDKVCEMCGIRDWNGRELVFELHHIDGNRNNNSLDNLMILCPNCHSQTDNFRNKSRK
nr:MAG TPA: NinG recombination protein [Caudoviricetes sp.]